jgi:hypothetical protein
MREQDLGTYTCAELEGHLSDLLEGHVTPALRDGLSLHLKGCVDCRSLRESVAASVLECRKLSSGIEPNPILVERLIRIAVPDWTTDCSTFEEHLSEFIDGTLDMNLRSMVSHHAETCMECGSLAKLVRQGVSELRDITSDAGAVRTELTARLARIPETENGVGFITVIKDRFARLLEIFDPVFASPLIGQSTVAVILIASAALFFGVPTAAEENDVPALRQGYKMVLKTYQDGSEAVMNAVSYVKPESTEALDR